MNVRKESALKFNLWLQTSFFFYFNRGSHDLIHTK